MTKLGNTERVNIWNSYFAEAREAAEKVKRIENDESVPVPKSQLEGGVMSPREHWVAQLILRCVLAIEARANHLISEANEYKKISEKRKDALLHLRTDYKWILLPIATGHRKGIDESKNPHQAVMKMCAHRDKLIHVKFNTDWKLPGPKEAVNLFNQFVEAMEDMNVVLERRTEPDNAVLNLKI